MCKMLLLYIRIMHLLFNSNNINVRFTGGKNCLYFLKTIAGLVLCASLKEIVGKQ